MGEAICKANASHYGAIGAKVRWERERLAKERAAQLAMLPVIQEPVAQPVPDEYSSDRLTRVRNQLNRLDRLVLTEQDPAKLDRLASAQFKLAEQERVLAGRPLPGSLRPVEAKAKRGLGSFEALSSGMHTPTNSVPPACGVPEKPQDIKP